MSQISADVQIKQEQESELKPKRERSPGFPCIPLKAAIDRLTSYSEKFGRHSTPIAKVSSVWNMAPKGSQSIQTIAALKYYGLINDEGLGDKRQIQISNDGQVYLRARQDEIKKKLLQKFALNPKEINKYWLKWGDDRPHNEVCLDTLTLGEETEVKYNDRGAHLFLKVYDETIEFAELSKYDKIESVESGLEEQEEEFIEREPDNMTATAFKSNQTIAQPQSVVKNVPVYQSEWDESALILEGKVLLKFPTSEISEESCTDLEDWFKNITTRLKRIAKSKANTPKELIEN
jgi:hypothetical protein